MRVLMFCSQFAPLIGGAERQAEKLSKALAGRGLDVTVSTPRLDPDSPLTEARDGFLVRRFPLIDLSKKCVGFHGIGLINAPWIGLQIFHRLWRELGDADIVHCHIGSLQSIAVACAARLRGVPVICKAAVADNHSDLGEVAKSGTLGRVGAWAGRFIFTRWVATTEAVREALVRAGVASGRIVVIPNGVEVAEGKPRAKDRPVRRFLYLGRLSVNAQRDVPGLLRAFDAVAAEVPDAELAVVGGGDLLDETRMIADACRHASRIRVTGPGDSAEWLNWADCFVLPSRREGLSNALLEAMAAGIACIAYDIPPNRETLADGAVGALVPVEDWTSLQRAMLRMARDQIHSERLAAAGAAHVIEHFSMSSVAKAYTRLYKSLALVGPGALS